MNRLSRYGDFQQTEAQTSQRTALFETEGDHKTFTDGSGNKYIFIDTTGGNVTYQLPRAKDTVGRIWSVKRLSGGANTLTVSTDGGNIDGAATHDITIQYESYSYLSDGDNYWIV